MVMTIHLYKKSLVRQAASGFLDAKTQAGSTIFRPPLGRNGGVGETAF